MVGEARNGRPKCIARVCWKCLAESPIREFFNSQIPGQVGHIESEWTMISASIVKAVAARSLVPVKVAFSLVSLWTPEAMNG